MSEIQVENKISGAAFRETLPKFSEGDTVFYITNYGVRIGKISRTGAKADFPYVAESAHMQSHPLSIRGEGSKNSNMPLAFPLTSHYRHNLVALFGEAQVPPLPPQGSTLTRALLEQKRYVKAWVSDVSDAAARESEEIALLEAAGDQFVSVTGNGYSYAVAFDDFGNEITELPNM